MRAIVKLEKLIQSFSSETATSPVMDMAVALAARQFPISCAVADTQQASTDPKIAQNNLSRVMP
jgi:hypothetical protein